MQSPDWNQIPATDETRMEDQNHGLAEQSQTMA